MSQQPERRGDHGRAQGDGLSSRGVPPRRRGREGPDASGSPETEQPPPPFDTETRLDHTEVDAERMEGLMDRRPRHGDGHGRRKKPGQGGKPGSTRDGGRRGNGGTDDARGV
jgi:hypothetical protein